MPDPFNIFWSDLQDHILLKNASTWLFRGHRNANWDLAPSIGRASIWSPKTYSALEERDLFLRFRDDVFEPRIVGRYTDFERLAIGQHYGLPSRLLDWTSNLLTAAFFASQTEDGVPEVDGRILMVSVPDDHVEWFWNDPFDAAGRSTPFFVRVPPFDVRLDKQQGLFSLHPDPCSVWDLSTTTFVIDALDVPAAAKPRLRETLSLLGFNNGRLLRDLDRACADLAASLKVV